MIAMPIKTENQNGILAPLFGKAKWFALIDESGSIRVEANSAEGGIKVARWFESLGVKTLITSHLGEKPFHALTKSGVKIYFAGSERISVEEALTAFQAGTLPEVNVSNYMELLGEEAQGHKHEGHCHHGDEKASFKTKLKCCETKGKNPLSGHGHKHAHAHNA